MAKGTFLKVLCPRCKSEQILFGKASTEVKCKECNYLLNKSNGGKAKIRAKIKDILWN